MTKQERLRFLKQEINKIYSKADDLKWESIHKNDDLKKMQEEYDEIKKIEEEKKNQKEKDKIYFKVSGDWGSVNHRGLEIIKENDCLVLCYKKGYTAYTDRVSGAVYAKPEFIIFRKKDKDNWNQGRVWNIEFSRGERKVALEKSIQMFDELCKEDKNSN